MELFLLISYALLSQHFNRIVQKNRERRIRGKIEKERRKIEREKNLYFKNSIISKEWKRRGRRMVYVCGEGERSKRVKQGPIEEKKVQQTLSSCAKWNKDNSVSMSFPLCSLVLNFLLLSL